MGSFYDSIKGELDALESKGGHSSFGADYDSNTAIVSQVQTAINKAGYQPPLTVDGAYGPKTKAGIQWIQEQKGLTADGIIGDQTLAALGIMARTRRSTGLVPTRRQRRRSVRPRRSTATPRPVTSSSSG